MDKISITVEHINRHLVCPLCEGYFRDPYTIAQCGETFCKSCLFNKLHGDNVKTRICPNPYCQMREPLKVAGTDYIGVEADHQKRAILDLIFPEWREEEEIKREEFYRSRGFIKKCEVDKGEDTLLPQPHEDRKNSDIEERIALKLGNKKQALSADHPLPRSTPMTEHTGGISSSSSGSKVTDSRTIKALINKKSPQVCQLPQIEKPLLRIPCRSMMSKLSFHIAKKLFTSRNKHLDLSPEGEYYKKLKLVSDLIVLKYSGNPDALEGQTRVLEKSSTAGDSFPPGSFSNDLSYLEVLYACSTEDDANTVIKLISNIPPPPSTFEGEYIEEALV